MNNGFKCANISFHPQVVNKRSLCQAIDANENVFAYQLEVGISCNFRPNVNFSLGYRFFDAADPEFVLPAGQRVRMELETHEFIFKMRYLFNL